MSEFEAYMRECCKKYSDTYNVDCRYISTGNEGELRHIHKVPLCSFKEFHCCGVAIDGTFIFAEVVHEALYINIPLVEFAERLLYQNIQRNTRAGFGFNEVLTERLESVKYIES